MTAPPEHTRRLDAYLDGQLSGADREAVERAMAADPTLAEEVRLQRTIDESLGRLFAGGAPVADPVGRGMWRGTGRLWIRPLVWSIAAALVIAASLWVFFGPQVVVRRGSGDPLGKLYADEKAVGFAPKEVCTTPEAFAEWTRQYVGQPIYPAAHHEGIEFVGWTYAPGVISGSTPVLLAKVDGNDVLVAMDRRVREKHELGTPCLPLHSFRAEVGSAVVYEVTPLDRPRIIPILGTAPGK